MDAFAGLKIELAAVVLLDVVAVSVFAAVELPAWQELAALAAVGVGTALWLVVRVRRLGRRLAAGKERGQGAE